MEKWIKDFFFPRDHRFIFVFLQICYPNIENRRSCKRYVDFMRLMENFCVLSQCRDEGVLVTPAHYLIEKEHKIPPASIRLTVSAQIEDEQIERLVRALELSTRQILPSFLS